MGVIESESNISDFGAEQVILVKDASTKEQLTQVLDERVVVLTILESKGMEFDDVLLYGFFSTSSSIAAFRSLKAHMQGELDSHFDSLKYAVSFTTSFSFVITLLIGFIGFMPGTEGWFHASLVRHSR